MVPFAADTSKGWDTLTVFDSEVEAMGHHKRLAELAFLIAFGLVEVTTTVFDQYPILTWLGAVVVLAILVDSLRCVRCQWRQLRENETAAEESPS